MIKFENLKIYNWYDAIRGMRNSFNSWDRMDSTEEFVVEGVTVNGFKFGEADYKLATKLSKAGRGHDKFLRQVLVSVDIIAPEYWWKEADTYKVGTVANSTSMMHTLGKYVLTENNFSFDDPQDEDVQAYLKLINDVRMKWVQAGSIKHSRCPHWRKMNQLMAISYLYRRTVTMNYAVLKGMYHDRKNHRLNEWSVGFRQWVESLPYAELITLKQGDKS